MVTRCWGVITFNNLGLSKVKPKNPSPHITEKKHPLWGAFSGAETGNRTQDTTIFSRVLYQLSYLGPCQCGMILPATHLAVKKLPRNDDPELKVGHPQADVRRSTASNTPPATASDLSEMVKQ